MILYKIENIINNKCYFGITKCSLNKRWNEHKCKCKNSKKHLYVSMRKYGIDNFKISLIKEFDNEDEMYLSEINYIMLYNTNNPKYGYNNSTGGELSSLGKKLSNETKFKISNYQKNRKRTPHSKETKISMSLSAKGRDMSKAIESSANKRRGKKAHNIKPIYSVDTKNVIKNYESITDASKNIKIKVSSISNNLNNKSKTAGGLIWNYQQQN